MTLNQEIWGMALWVEKHHGERGPYFIADQVERNRLAGEQGGVDLWEAVGRRFASLTDPLVHST